MIVVNQKKQRQEICLTDGSSIVLSKGESYDLDESLCYNFEIDRIKSCLKVLEEAPKPKIKNKKKEEVKVDKTDIPSFLDGGNK